MFERRTRQPSGSGPGSSADTTAETPDPAVPDQAVSGPAAGQTLVERAYEQLHEVIDPEVGVNIVDLGLVFDVEVADAVASVRMTLTSPGCPLGGYMDNAIRQTLIKISGVEETSMDLVWEPAWGPELMSDVAKRQLGWLP